MTALLDILSVGAVTPVGLDAYQTAAAFRARIVGFGKAIPQDPPLEAFTAAQIPVHASLRSTEREWLINMAARAVREALQRPSLPSRVGLFLALPEDISPDIDPYDLVASVAAKTGMNDRTQLCALPMGTAAIATGLKMAADAMRRGDLDACIVGGVDSLVTRSKAERLQEQGRILEEGNPQGLVPGEGAAAVLVVPSRYGTSPLASVYGIGEATESDPVTGERLSQGRAFQYAITDAIRASGMPEAEIDFRISSLNGEHYAVWESTFYAIRSYRSRRESFPVWYTASSVGEVGAAAGALALVLASMAIAGGYAPGPFAMCETASEGGGRAACLVGAAAGARQPPFRPEGGETRWIRQYLAPAR